MERRQEMTPKLFKVKRITQGCCGMEQGKEYLARWEMVGCYIQIKLSDNEWTFGHWFQGHFEVVK